MNTHQTDIAIFSSMGNAVAEYDAKVAAIPDAVAAFEAAGDALKAAACVKGEWGGETINVGSVHPKTIERSLRRSAWNYFWKEFNMPEIASAADKKRFDQSMADPPPFDLDTLMATFGPYLDNPRASILRGLAEVFTGLDPAYKSHEKVKIGVKGLPKRVVLPSIGTFYGYGEDKLRDIINALAAVQGKPLIEYSELRLLLANGDALRDGGTFPHPHNSRHESNTITVIGRGIWLKRFQNGNGHLFFGPEALRDINLALAEFYGDVLADCPDEDEARPARRTGTAVAKDLQFYPTPEKVIDRLLEDIYLKPGMRVLEPSCGDGRIMDAVRKAGADVWGVEVDAARAAETRAKGHKVVCANFLETQGPARPELAFDAVVMNPPFYGKHYAKHVRHALRFLKPGGVLVAVLPATARYDHGLLDDLRPSWTDLPVGAFRESGTNICTVIANIRAPAAR
jgi:hypothetical protein